ncbi:MAG: hypothetical protein R3C16_09110 [Hyphomonadaceae bacterium]
MRGYKSGQFKDIQTFKRAHAADLRSKSKAELEAAETKAKKKKAARSRWPRRAPPEERAEP